LNRGRRRGRVGVVRGEVGGGWGKWENRGRKVWKKWERGRGE